MSLETQIASLVTAANNLTTAVNGKIASIDQKVAAATDAVPSTVRAEVSKTLYVDASAGVDTNSGVSSAAPLKTISAALDKVITGGTAIIKLRRGQVYEVQRKNVNEKSLSFEPYGTETSRPIIRGMASDYSGGTVKIVGAFQGTGRVSVKFTEMRVETGLLPAGSTKYGAPDFGGFFSREGGAGESVIFEVMFNKCDIAVQDFELFSTYYGSMIFSAAATAITRGGTQAKVIDSQIPKIIDLVNVTISGFPVNSSVETLLSLNSGAYISRQIGSSLNNAT